MTGRLLLALAILLAGQSAFAQPGDWSYGDRRDGVHLRIMRSYELPAGATAQEPIVVIGGSATINGRAEDDVVVIGGSVRVGPTAVVRGDIVAIGGGTSIDPAAQVSGTVDQTLIVGPDFDFGIGPFVQGGWWPAFAFGASMLRLAIILAIAMLLTVAAPDWIHSIRLRVSSSPLGAAVGGLAGQILFVPATIAVTIALVVSIVGILLLLAFPFVMGAAALLWVAGYTAVAINIGSALRGRDVVTSRPRVGDLLLGFVLICGVTLIAHTLALTSGPLGPAVWLTRMAGWVIEWMAWTVGLGAALWSLMGGRQAVTPPPMPFATPAPTAP